MKAPIKIFSSKKCDEIMQQLSFYEKQINTAVDFIQKIEDGELDITIDKSESDNALAKSLLSMQARMKEISRKEQQRNWATEGLAKFSEILREDKADLEAFGDSIISNLVKYMNVNQGGLFVKNKRETDNEDILQLVAAYAYNKKKYLEKEIELDEGLVGQCYFEKDIIYMTEVPQFYTEITSGLGEATPSAILLVPLKVNDAVYGVIELASFKPFEQYQIDFLKKLAENIASAISSVKTAERTNYLLAEAQSQAEELQAQEEELRQNMEEIEATNEEMNRQRKELEEKDLELQKVIKEMEANEKDMQKAEDKNRKVVKDFLLLKKEHKKVTEDLSEKDDIIKDQQQQIDYQNYRINELEKMLAISKSA